MDNEEIQILKEILGNYHDFENVMKTTYCLTDKRLIINNFINNYMKTTDNAVTRLREISAKNKDTDEYSLGDVLLLAKFEKELRQAGWSDETIELLSPSYY